jgi:hypothetical protein
MSINKLPNESKEIMNEEEKIESGNKYLPVRYLKISDEPRLTETYNHLTDKTCNVIGCDKEIEYFTTYTNDPLFGLEGAENAYYLCAKHKEVDGSRIEGFRKLKAPTKPKDDKKHLPT